MKEETATIQEELHFYDELLRAEREGRMMSSGGGGPRPAIYKGIAFATRLEAAWARHLDNLNIHWCYEEGHLFHLSNCYVEVFAKGEQRYDKTLVPQSLLKAELASWIAVYVDEPNVARADIFRWDGTVERDVETGLIFHR